MPANNNSNSKILELESRIAQLEARLENKKDDIHDINKELIHERNTMIALREDIAEMKVLLNEWHTQNQKIDKSLDKLNTEVQSNKNDIKRLNSVIDTLKWVIMAVFASATGISFIITRLFG